MPAKFNYRYFFLFLMLFVLGLVTTARAQTTEFTYQGRLTDSGQTANGNYDFEFRLFDAETGGSSLALQQHSGVAVTGGIFSVKLDFGANFNGQGRFLEIAVKPTGSTNSFTVLSPRQPVTSAPYSIKSLNAETATNALQLGGITANQYIQTNDPRLNDDRNPLSGSANYIQNATTPQTNANFNISGNGNLGGTLSANTFNSANGYNIGDSSVLSVAGANNVFAGIGAGQSNTSGRFNAFFGNGAGAANTTGAANSIFGAAAGSLLTNGGGNSFFGNGAGQQVTGNNNSFFGNVAGSSASNGNNNTAIGSGSFVSSNLSFATVIGSDAQVRTSNTVVLGRDVDTVRVPGFSVVEKLGAAGSQTLCRNATQQISSCSSSLRYKTKITTFDSGLNLVRRLRPIVFKWKTDGTKDLGLGAEEVAEIEPLLVTYNLAGEVEGVKYDRIAVVLLNAVKEQQAQIERQKIELENEQANRRQQDAKIERQAKQLQQQQKQIEQQQELIEGLKQLVCKNNQTANICQ